MKDSISKGMVQGEGGKEKETKDARERKGRIQTLLGESVYYFPLSRSVMMMVLERISFLNNVL